MLNEQEFTYQIMASVFVNAEADIAPALWEHIRARHCSGLNRSNDIDGTNRTLGVFNRNYDVKALLRKALTNRKVLHALYVQYQKQGGAHRSTVWCGQQKVSYDDANSIAVTIRLPENIGVSYTGTPNGVHKHTKKECARVTIVVRITKKGVEVRTMYPIP